MQINPWIQSYNEKFPLVIAGPCSAETEEQVLKIAHELKNSGVSIFRSGIWKPRTRPGGFEGVGEIGLKWLQKAKQETGLKMAIEVANATHVKLALEHDIDVLWIGARTTVNPFAVQEIADALQNTDKIVLLKNPVNPDLSLWIGGLERLYQANIKNVGVIHRGFSTYEKTKYRNNPEWQIAIDFKTRFPNIPIIIDPSHISGRRDLIAEVTQQALDLNYDGMIIETHHTPDLAWSDAAQQVTPERLLEILEILILRNEDNETDEYQQKMNLYRKKIDSLDAKILEVLGTRMEVARAIGILKQTKNVAVLQSQRWLEILEKMKKDGSKLGLSEDFITQFFKAIHQESIQQQEKEMKK
uniref:bifunctional 3-deoxy-7-phosphoheptulonate synthase/chorismate mutase type II n=2 Tax=Flavobacterium sp. TaxID=239 RepID=UPI004048EE71